MDSTIVYGNSFDKYRSANPLHQLLMKGFLDSAQRLLAGVTAKDVLEVGCGPGDLAGRLWPDSCGDLRYLGIDISKDDVRIARDRYPYLCFEEGSAYELPGERGAYDLVLACEVIEHLDDPAAAMREIARVAKGHVLVSVPWEPMWRVLNVARGKYLSQFGNTAGHLQHFSRAAIRRLVREHFTIVCEQTPFPWTMLLAQAQGI